MAYFTRLSVGCLIVCCVVVLVGCGREASPARERERTRSQTSLPTRSPSLAEGVRLATPEDIALVPDGTRVLSPDSGKPVVKRANTPALVYKGRLYLFCCPTSMMKCGIDPRVLQNATPPNGFELGELSKD